MRNRKNALPAFRWLIAAVSAGVLLAGCAQPVSSASAAPAATGKPAAASTAAAAAPAGDGVTLTSPVQGMLSSYSGEMLNVVINGITYAFHVPDQSVFSTGDALMAGDTVEITFTGTVQGPDASGATVTKVQDKTSAAQQLQTIVGTVTDATGTTITIQTASALLSFNVASAQIITANGIVIGNTVYIDYYGTISGTDTSKCAVQTVVDNDDNQTPIPTVIPTPTPIATATPTPVPTLVPVANIPVVATDEWMYAVCDSNIYQGNSTSYQKVSYLYNGQAISVTGRTNDGWTRVNQEGTVGFVPSTCLTSNAPATPTPTPTPAPTPKPAPTPTPVVSHNLIINYKDSDGNTMFHTYVAVLPEGAAYSIDSPLNMGSTPSQETVSGTMGTQDITVNVIYTPFYQGVGGDSSQASADSNG